MNKILMTISCIILSGFIYSQNTVTDIDGNVYKTVKIGKQEWMAENLNVSTFRNGDTIPEVKTKIEWKKFGIEGKPVWCYFENKTSNDTIYGGLYSWYAVNDSRGLAPAGWHVPTEAEWIQLVNYLGEDEAGTKMKTTEGWKDNGNGTNSSGFNGLPGGYCDPDGDFDDHVCCGFWWGSTGDETGRIRPRSLRYNYTYLYRDFNEKEYGMSVRCVKD